MNPLVCFLHTPQPHIDPNSVVLPYLWALFKTYYEHQSTNKDSWLWIQPEITPLTLDEWISTLSAYDHIDVVGVSQYIWNHEDELHALCAWIKKRFPTCIIALGGPQPNIKYTYDYFRKHTHVDIVCDQSGYGELFWTALMDQIAEGSYDPSVIPYAIYPDRFRMKCSSNISPHKREFQWCPNPYTAQHDTMLAFFEYAADHDLIVKASVEGTRGCPYTCTFCDWGGGTGTKVITKPCGQLLDEYEYLIKHGVLVINIMDANLGISSRDLDLVHSIAELRDRYNHSDLQLTVLGFAKHDKRYVNQIIDYAAEVGLIQEHFVSAQSFNEESLRAIRRKDSPWRQQMHDLVPLRKKYPDFIIRLQVIAGLPNSTLDEFYTWFDVLQEYDASIISAFWLLLPATPAYDPEYIKKYELGVTKYRAFMHTSMRRVHEDDFDSRGVVEYPIVTSSNTYTKDEWEEIAIVMQFMAASAEVKWLPRVMKSLHIRTGMSHSELYRSFVAMCLKDANSPLHVWYAQQLRVLRGDGILDVYRLPVDDGYIYCGEAYWIEMMSTDVNWMPTVVSWSKYIIDFQHKIS